MYFDTQKGGFLALLTPTATPKRSLLLVLNLLTQTYVPAFLYIISTPTSFYDAKSNSPVYFDFRLIWVFSLLPINL